MKASLREEKAGSALLVVLGFLSFMVISAVAFAIYMRAERVPSSALRRNVATRHLVKAALAHAMSRVDDAIRADPFPGLPCTNGASTVYRDGNKNLSNLMDVWYGRVFMPPDPEGTTREANDPNNPGDSKRGFASRFAPVTETVSTLTLEGLGYLPPALVNDVRFLSRSTWTAKWQNFAYDAGRFAFCAVNVSDYFDVNRATAGVRTSAPDSRISLATLLRNNETRLDSVDTSAADTFNDLFGPDISTRQTDTSVQGTVPYVSLLDYNLALGSKYGDGGVNGLVQALFWRWIGGSSRNFYYDGTAGTDPGVQKAARQTFVTDSWNVDLGDGARTNATEIAYLENTQPGPEMGQPFSTAFLKRDSANVTFMDIVQEVQRYPFSKNLGTIRNLVPAFMASLYDYLDGNDYPLSLAFPCCERVPMVAALGLRGMTVNLNFTAAGSTEMAEGDSHYKVTEYQLQGDVVSGALEGLAVFPFKRGRDFPKTGYAAQAMVRVFLGAQGFSAQRTATAAANLRPTKEEWDAAATPFTTKRGLANAFVATALSSSQGLTIPSDVQGENDIGIPFAFTFSAQAPGTVFMTRKKMKASVVNGVTTYSDDATAPTEYQIPVLPFLADGKLMNDGQVSGWMDEATFNSAYNGKLFVPYVAVWVRITKDGNTAVDYVPALYDDDKDMLGPDNVSGNARTFYPDGGPDTPLLKWTGGGNGFEYRSTLAPFSCSDWGLASYFTIDPRYNWAPEDWVQTGQNVGLNSWLSFLDNELAVNGRDSDVFMFASNQGYLQSAAEFAFLPRITDLEGNVIAANWNSSVVRTEADGHLAPIAHRDSAWTSYRPYDMNGGASDRLFNRRIVDGAGSVAVNPYTDNAEVRLAAFANTPYDWWAAGTNWNSGTVDSDATTEYFSKKSYIQNENVKQSLKYAFTDSGSDAKLEYKDVAKIAASICERIRANPDQSWEDVYDNLDWCGDPNDLKNFNGVQLDNELDGADRKFLYGYWRNCLANKQQLFLIFVRAESTALGGPGEGTPAQQGGRAVALVWREPQSNTTNGGQNGANDDRNTTYMENRRPHRMRVLFYHQFD